MRPEGTYAFLDCTEWCKSMEGPLQKLQQQAQVGGIWQDGVAFHGPLASKESGDCRCPGKASLDCLDKYVFNVLSAPR